MDVITELLVGYSVHCLNADKRALLMRDFGTSGFPNTETVVAPAGEGADDFGFAATFGRWQTLALSHRFYRDRRSIRAYVDWFANRRLQQLSGSDGDGEQKDPKGFIFLNHPSTHFKDPVRLRDELMGLLAAGRSTTASLISWVLFHLARKPNIYSKLRAIIVIDFGDLDLERMDANQLRGCKYLQMCINESLRLGTPTPSTMREAAKDTTLPKGGGPDGQSPIFIRKGTPVILNFFGLHHRSDIWGEDAEEFKPERWEQRDIDWTFVPFVGGPRKCLGQQLALTEVSYIIARFVQQYDRIENMDPSVGVVHHSSVSNKPGTGNLVRLHRAKSHKHNV